MASATACRPAPAAPSSRPGASRAATGSRSRTVAGRPVWRVRDRASFAALRRSRARVRGGPVSVTWTPPASGADDPPRVAFAIGKRTGGAVLRNRVRRRLRAAFTDLAGQLAPGTYLVTAGSAAADLPYDALRSSLSEACTTVSVLRS